MPDHGAVAGIGLTLLPAPPPLPTTMYVPLPVNPTEECCEPSKLCRKMALPLLRSNQTPSGVLCNLAWMGKVYQSIIPQTTPTKGINFSWVVRGIML